MRLSALLASAVLSLTVASFVAGLGLLLAAGQAARPLHQFLAFPAEFLAFAAVGMFIALKRPRNPVGWMLSAIGLLASATLLADGYGLFSLRVPGAALPGGVVAAWVRWWVWVPVFVILPFILWLFPDGHWLSPRWQRWGFVLIGISTGTLVLGWFVPGPLPLLQFQRVDNPFGIAAFAAVADANAAAGALAMLAAYPLAVASLVIRFRRASGPERQQLKWVASAGVIYVVVFVSLLIAWAALFDPEAPYPLAAFAGIPHGLAVASIAIAIGVAILRYRLYDIDVLINRTLVYGALSATLLATYLLSVLALSALLRPVTGPSDLAVAGSTLLVVALFAPLRRRIQAVVDRRFYRSRYDAARTLDAFSARLRDEVDLDSVRADLLHVVHDTVQPAHASVWLRSERAR